MTITVRRLQEKDFLSIREEWSNLLANSSADKLFLSWAWQVSWWETWSRQLESELVLLATYCGEELVGIAPLYLDVADVTGFLRVKRLQFIGNAWRKQNTVRTEYTGFIVNQRVCREVVRAMADFLVNEMVWDEFVVCDADRNSEGFKILRQRMIDKGLYTLERSIDNGVIVETNFDFDTYLQTVGKNTRLKLYNRRNYLAQKGKLEVIKTSNFDEIDVFFASLNALHKTRWGKDCFIGDSLLFHKRFIERASGEMDIKCSTIKIDGEVLSTLYNVKVGAKEYNIQAGFLEEYDKKVSLGTLHLGYAIEAAFKDKDVLEFDLLAGHGKNTFYKARLSGRIVDFVTLQCVKRRRLSLIYRIYFSLPLFLRRALPRRLLFGLWL